MEKKLKFSVKDMAIVGVLAAICFVVTYFFNIKIPTPAGTTMIKLGNVFCLLSGLLFGGVRGGLAAGIGSMMFDLFDPQFVASAPYTLVFFFAMGFVCGTISNLNGANGQKLSLNIIGAIAGSLTYFVLSQCKNLIFLMIAGSKFFPALVALVPKMVSSLINAVIAVTVSCLIAPMLSKALKKAGIK